MQQCFQHNNVQSQPTRRFIAGISSTLTVKRWLKLLRLHAQVAALVRTVADSNTPAFWDPVMSLTLCLLQQHLHSRPAGGTAILPAIK